MTRIIAKLDVKPPMTVKPVHFEGLRKIGPPNEIAVKYYLQGADEIFYIDIVASLYRRKILLDEVKSACEGIFVPFAVGGGVKSEEDFSTLFQHGADKVIINTFALQEDPTLISRASRLFGSQSVVVNIEAKKKENTWEAYSDCGRIESGKPVLEWIQEVEERGAGEILLQSVDMDGRQRGFDIDLIGRATEATKIPVVAASGAGTAEDVLQVIRQANPSGVAIASLLHFNQLTIRSLKEFLLNNDIEVAL